MAVAEAARHSVPRALPAPWWRGKAGAAVLVVVAMIIAYLGWKSRWAWPASLEWNSLSPHLDRFQAWLSNNRNLPHPNIAFRIFNGFASFLDDLVSWLTRFFYFLKLAGHGGARDVDRAALRRREGGDRDVRGVRELRGARPLGRGRPDLRPDVRGGRALTRCRHAARRHRRAIGKVQPRDHARFSMRCRSSRRSHT